MHRALDKAENFSDNGQTITFEQSADGLKMKTPSGYHYDAKFDGKDYPLEGSRQVDRVALKRIKQREIEEPTNWRGRLLRRAG